MSRRAAAPIRGRRTNKKGRQKPMRLLILSDIHANIAALRAIEKDAGAVDAIYCAGDYVDYGTDPHEAIGWSSGTRRALRHGQPRQTSAQHPVFGRGGCVSGNKSLQMGARQLRTGDG
ncbi:MAG: metallophosphoesterase family protein [Christensenellales bacterium]